MTSPSNSGTVSNTTGNRKTTLPVLKDGMSYKSWKNKIDM